MERNGRNRFGHRSSGQPVKKNFPQNDNNGSRNYGETSSNATRNQKLEASKPIGYKTLENVLKIDGEAELILKLSSERNGFLLLMDQKNIRSDLMCLILAALARASECSAEQDTVQLLVHFYIKIIPKLNDNANFQRELVLYSANLRSQLALDSPQRQKHVDAVQNLLQFLRRLQLTLYQKSFDAVQYIVHQFASQIEYINRKGNSLSDRIAELLDELNDSMQNFDRMKAATEKHEVLLEPPENFREISIYPNTEDILYNHEPFIRRNVVDGKYVGGVDHYLDTQFRLLREDFVRPLRHGISEYARLKNKVEGMKLNKYRIKDLNVYPNVQIVSSQNIHNEQVYLCKFDCKPFQHLRWQYNKRMLNGTLMCFSPDDFKTFFFATVAGQRDPAKLARGEFQIKLEIELALMPEITPLITYVMVESQVYFEAYRHNLKVLQELQKKNFPLERYIVDVNNEILPPTYLSEDAVYQIPNGLTESDAKNLPVQILRRQEWPTCTDFNLDESQFEAFQAALTKQMVIIQGPPGTGKTYIGLRIVETLLANTTARPILIVCYTNHALDQFLEGILKFCGQDDLVRIGGKSQSEALQNLNLSNVKKAKRDEREVSQYIRNARFESTAQMKNYQEKISKLEHCIEDLNKRFFGSELQSVIVKCNPLHLHQLRQFSRGNLSHIGILNWLGCEVKNENNGNANQDANPDGIDISETNEVVFEGPVLAEEVFDEEEIKEIERSRLIDYDWDDEGDQFYPTLQTEHRINLNNIVSINYDDTSADGYTEVKNRNKGLKYQFKREIGKSQTMSREEAAKVRHINSLSLNERWDLYRLWVKLYTQELVEKIKENRDSYRNECLRFNGIRNQEDIEVVQKAKIIGMTTTGAAKYRHIITGAKPRITIVEEAAEVLEAHIVTALCGKTDHLILIGDHMQLKPNPAVYELAKKFNLEISLFERLIKNKMNFYQLKQQHRMRPCISSLLVPLIYKQLRDHPSVEKYENVKGIAKNMFFINHQENESSQQETRSHMNAHEASFIVELCRYIILQGYDSSQVTILTTYSGQLHLIRQLMRDQHLLNGVRAAVVDNYQGEESDIILLSFVRSNDEANIGFLKTSNRINVALSRARKGLYCIGNFDCLAEKSPLWQNLMENLAIQDAVGDKLAIYCQNHSDYKVFVASKNDFSQVPDGGCIRPCDSRLPCGHSCPSVCHIVDAEHMNIYKRCMKNCDKIVCENQHRCQKKCHFEEECGKCTVMVEKLRSECSHSVLVACSSDPSKAFCSHPCERERSCGHKCKGLCGKLCDETVCNELVEAKSPCNHTVNIKCSDANSKSKLLDACDEICDVELKCGHLCKGSCGRCKYGRLHISCPEKCSRILICGHPCTDLCSIDCPPCTRRCTNRCVHSKCSKSCGEPCPPCMEKCKWQCKHLKCTKLCSEACDRQLCEHPDKRKLRKCGHPSIAVCGEKMPRQCRVCNKDEVEEIFFGNEDKEDARFIELDDCKHIIEVQALIQWMKAEPDSVDTNLNDANHSSIQLKKCPKCKTEIRHTKALNTYIQASLKDIHQVKLQTYGQMNENRSTQLELNEKTGDILTKESFRNRVVHLSAIYAEIFHKTDFERKNPYFRPRPKHLLIELENKFKLVQRLQQICLYFEKRNQKEKNICDEAIAKFEERIHMAAVFIKDYRNSDQKRLDIEREVSFLQTMVTVIVEASVKPFNELGKESLNQAFEQAHKYGSATESVQKEFMKLVNEAFKHATGLGISINEKNMVLKAMGFQKGHWYKCPNGHIYCIADCGGATVRSKCPDCKAVIGGENHQLAPSNALATEMDGATGPAWPTNLMQQLHPFMD